MDRETALKMAIDLAKVAIQSADAAVVPCEDYAENIADFIETLSRRLQKFGAD